MTRRVTIIVGDVVGSGKIADRPGYWKKLRKSTKRINRKYKEAFLGPLMVLMGDEVSAVLKNLKHTYPIMRDFQEMLHPYRIRFVSVVGEVDLALSTKNASLMDGPAFWKANEHLENIKRKKMTFLFDLGNERIDGLLTATANLIACIKEGWTERERELISQYEELGKQEMVAERYQVSQQAVSSALRRARWKEINAAEETILRVMDSYPDARGD